MSRHHWSARVLGAIAFGSLAILSSYSVAGAQEPADPSTETGVAELVSPFRCGTAVDGSTYGGHGANNWNLDMGRAGLASEEDRGLPLFAQGDGTVVWFKQTGYNNRAGTYLEIDYGDVTARYVHLVESSIPPEVAVSGARVTRGQLIGQVGDTGRASGPHLHLEYWDSRDFVDTAWYQLPRGNQIPVFFAGVPQVATPGTPTEPSVSTNCTGDARVHLRPEGLGRRLH